MKKFAVCYQASFQELKHVKTLTTAAMLMAVSVVLGYFTIEAGPYLKIGFGGVVNQFVYYLFGLWRSLGPGQICRKADGGIFSGIYAECDAGRRAIWHNSVSETAYLPPGALGGSGGGADLQHIFEHTLA